MLSGRRELASWPAVLRADWVAVLCRNGEMIGAQDGGVDDAAGYLATMMRGMGDDVEWSGSDDGVVLEQLSLRVIRGLGEAEAGLVFDCWAQFGRAPPARSGSSNDLKCSVWVTLRAGLCRSVCDGTD